MSKSAKKHTEAMSQIDRSKVYELKTALDVVKKASYVKFDETVDVAVKLARSARSVHGQRNQGEKEKTENEKSHQSDSAA